MLGGLQGLGKWRQEGSNHRCRYVRFDLSVAAIRLLHPDSLQAP